MYYKYWYFLNLFLMYALLSGCTKSQLLTYSSDTPPMVLSPTLTNDISDGRARFREIYCAVQEKHGKNLPDDRPCEKALVRLNNEPEPTKRPVYLGKSRLKLRIIVVPGIFGECVIDRFSPFSYALTHINGYGYATDVIRVSGRSSCAHNAVQIRDAILENRYPPDEDIILIGYSKGVPDIMEALVTYPDLAEKVKAVVSFAGVVNGTPIADKMVKLYSSLLKDISLPPCPAGDGGEVKSLSRHARMQWLSRNKLPGSVGYFSLAAFPEPDNISAILKPIYKTLAKVSPRNDSQVIFFDAIMPGSTLLGFANADHWAIAMPFARKSSILGHTLINRNAFPREILLESVVRYVEEVLIDNK